MCSTNEPKVRRDTGATVKGGSRLNEAANTDLPGYERVYLRLPTASPPCQYRCRVRKATTSGMIDTSEPTMIRFHSDWPPPLLELASCYHRPIPTVSGIELGAGQHGQRQEVVVPGADHRQQQHGDDAGPHQRQRDPQERAQFAGAVDARGVQQFVRHRARRVDPHQVDGERTEQGRQDHRPDRVGEPDVAHHDEGRDDQRGERDHDRAQDEREDDAAPTEAELREPVAGQHRHDRAADAAGERVQHGVAEPAQVLAVVVGEQVAQVVEQVEAGEPQGAGAGEQARGVLGAGHHEPPDGTRK